MKYFFQLLFLLICFESQSQQITTFILVRHAEKKSDNSKDPELTEAGQLRAKLLASMLKDTKIDAVYSTAFKRTTGTVEPIANAKGIVIKNYDAMKPGPIDEMLKIHAGGTVLISGHSNTIPWTVNYLLRKEELKTFDDSDYDNILIVDVVEQGKVVKMVWLSY